LNYVRGDWETNQIIGIPLEDPIEGTLNTLAVQIKEHSCRPDRELAQTLSVADWLWDLNTYAAPARLIEESITSDKQFAKWAKKDILKVCWNELPSASFEDYIVPNLITANKFRAAVIPRIAWSVLDNWVAIHRLLYESGLFVIQPVEGIHQIDSQDNLVFKPTDKEVALYGVSDLIVIDTGDRLLIGTPEGLHENF
jgi:mannose-1-phosphate guanylyltransferase